MAMAKAKAKAVAMAVAMAGVTDMVLLKVQRRVFAAVPLVLFSHLSPSTRMPAVCSPVLLWKG